VPSTPSLIAPGGSSAPSASTPPQRMPSGNPF
jgi:hypothetical protein